MQVNHHVLLLVMTKRIMALSLLLLLLFQVKPLLELVPDAKYPLELVNANLNDKDCWGPAVEGCTYVFHVASPNPIPDTTPDDEN